VSIWVLSLRLHAVFWGETSRQEDVHNALSSRKTRPPRTLRTAQYGADIGDPFVSLLNPNGCLPRAEEGGGRMVAGAWMAAGRPAARHLTSILVCDARRQQLAPAWFNFVFSSVLLALRKCTPGLDRREDALPVGIGCALRRAVSKAVVSRASHKALAAGDFAPQQLGVAVSSGGVPLVSLCALRLARPLRRRSGALCAASSLRASCAGTRSCRSRAHGWCARAWAAPWHAAKEAAQAGADA